MSGSHFEQSLTKAVDSYGESVTDDLDLPVSGFDFAELMVMAIIRGNPTSPPGGPTDKQRFADAMRALFGSSRQSRSDKKDDTYALRIMAQWYDDERRDGVTKPSSIDDLAARAAKWAEGGETNDASTLRLSRAFSRAKDELVRNLDHRYETIEIIQRWALHDLEEMLPQLGICFHADQ